MYIAIAGNIGSGKTYLAELIGQKFGWETYYENSDNPYIGDFYEDMRRWSFNLQIYFLGKRLGQMSSIVESGINTVADRTIYEDARVFATHLHNAGLLSSRDYQTYMQIYNFTVSQLAPPDLLIYLRASGATLVNQIRHRGRNYEAAIDENYLNSLSQLYQEWISEYKGKVMIIDIDKDDFITDEKARMKILEKIADELGLKAE